MLLAPAGCGGAAQRLPIHGTVTYKGQPLAAGTITFTPKADGPLERTMEGALITDGKYAIPADKGLFPGSYHVSISAVEPSGKPPGGAPGGPRRSKELLPERYNTQSTLSIDVDAKGKREFDFPLE
jgi:hypothetical protein